MQRLFVQVVQVVQIRQIARQAVHTVKNSSVVVQAISNSNKLKDSTCGQGNKCRFQRLKLNKEPKHAHRSYTENKIKHTSLPFTCGLQGRKAYSETA